MESVPYTNREMDMKFKEVMDVLHTQNESLAKIDTKVATTNGSVARAFVDIANTKADAASNWRAIQVGTAIFICVVIPLCGIIYYNLTKQVGILQGQVIKIQTK